MTDEDLAPATRRALEAMLEPDAACQNPVITYTPLTPERIRAILVPCSGC